MVDEGSVGLLLRQLEERLLQPEARKSAEAVGDLLADRFVEFGCSGRIHHKEESIRGLENEPMVRRSLTDFKTTILAPDIVLVTYRAAKYGAPGEQPAYSLRSSIWKIINGRWQIVFHQGTLTTESSDA